MKPQRHFFAPSEYDGISRGYYFCEDVDPLLSEKDAEIERLTEQLRLCNVDQVNCEAEVERLKDKRIDCEHVAQDVIKGGCPKCELAVAEESNKTLHQRIKEQAAEIERLKELNETLKDQLDGMMINKEVFMALQEEVIDKDKRIEELEAELRTQKDECERFHKPA